MKILELKNISKSFGAIHALENVDLDISQGEALGLMGDNGAGKSTLMKIVAGNFSPTNGEIFVEGKKPPFLILLILETMGSKSFIKILNCVII